jgi:hypothetical protein
VTRFFTHVTNIKLVMRFNFKSLIKVSRLCCFGIVTECAVHRDAPWSNAAPVRPVLSKQPDEDPTNARPGGTRQGRCTLGCSRLGRPPRASSNAIETKEK